MIAIVLSFLISYEYTSVQQVRFAKEQVQFAMSDEYTKIRVADCELSDIVGAPEIPTKALKVALPYGATDIGIQIIGIETETLHGEYLLPCIQPPQILSRDEPRQTVQPDHEIYSSNELYPSQAIELRGKGRLDNYEICELVAYPIQYSPRFSLRAYPESDEATTLGVHRNIGNLAPQP